MKYSKEQFKGAFNKLSEIDKTTFMSIEISESVWGIAEKYNLSKTQEIDLVNLTSSAILKLDPLENLIDNIAKTIQVDPNRAIAIKDDLITQVIGKFENYRTTNFIPASENPQSIPSSFMSNDGVEKSVMQIAERQRLSTAQKLALVDVVNNILNGRTGISSFRANLVSELNISYDQALKISFDVNAEIFNPVMGNLKNLEAKLKNADEAEEPEEEVSVEETPDLPADDSQSMEKSRTEPDRNIRHLLPDHDEMEREDGPHLHSQSVMPTSALSAGNFMPPPKKTFGSIVEQKLSRIVGSNSQQNPANQTNTTANSTPAMTAKPGVKTYSGNDPYREPLE